MAFLKDKTWWAGVFAVIAPLASLLVAGHADLQTDIAELHSAVEAACAAIEAAE